MLDPKIATITKVAVFASSQDQRQHLQTMLEKNGLDVVVSEAAGDQFLSALNQNPADVLLIDLRDDEEDDDLDFLDTLTEQSDIPILFNDSGPEGVSLSASGDNWAKKLADSQAETSSQIRRAFLQAYSREPDDEEQAACQEVVQQHGLKSLCRAIFNSNEFLFLR